MNIKPTDNPLTLKPKSSLVMKTVAICVLSALTVAGKAETSNAGNNASTDALAAGGQDNSSSGSPLLGFFNDWMAKVSQIQSEQPHWVTPLFTVTPRLEQELRYDQYWESLPGGRTLDNYGAGKGLEIIPALPIEFIFGIPAWESKNTSPTENGWADETFLLKCRLWSANEDQGNYIVTGFLGLSAPSGSDAYTAHHYEVTPTIAFGKGWGDFDFQSTFGVVLPDDGSARVGPGESLAWNTALQYHVMKYLWPEVELNYTYYANGEHDNLTQAFVTPGLLIGRIPLAGRLGLTFGAGCQIAVTEHPRYRHNIILSARLPF